MIFCQAGFYTPRIGPHRPVSVNRKAARLDGRGDAVAVPHKYNATGIRQGDGQKVGKALSNGQRHRVTFIYHLFPVLSV